MHQAIDIISAPFSMGGRHWGCNLGPNPFLLRALSHQLGHDAFRAVRFLDATPCLRQLSSEGIKPAQLRRMKRSVTQSYLVSLAKLCYSSYQSGSIPVVLGGDHTIAMGTWRGIAQAVEKPIGMLWVDAHLDSHNWESSDSGNMHGMPLANLLGEAPLFSHRLLSERSVLDSEFVSVMGVRSYEAAEWALVERLGLSVVKDSEVRAEQFAKQLRQQLDRVSACPRGYAVSIDMDAFNPVDFSAVSVPEAGGIHLEMFIDALNSIKDRFPSPLGIEIVEYNPFIDQRVRVRNRKRVISLLRALLKVFY